MDAVVIVILVFVVAAVVYLLTKTPQPSAQTPSPTVVQPRIEVTPIYTDWDALGFDRYRWDWQYTYPRSGWYHGGRRWR